MAQPGVGVSKGLSSMAGAHPGQQTLSRGGRVEPCPHLVLSPLNEVKEDCRSSLVWGFETCIFVLFLLFLKIVFLQFCFHEH